MSTTVDERVVSLQFDNRNFEKNVSTSLSTLDKLKQKLNFSGASKGLEEVDAVAKAVDMTTLENGVDKVQVKFSALQTVAVSALATITSSAVNAGISLAKSLSVDQVTAGWNKYEQKTSSVQTIMNATGKSIDEVNAYLDKLMWYSDETSYGFTDMTASLAQLTSAGGDIDKLIPMIEGIANATAFAGKGAAEFSRAIYNLNQSYSAGHLQYMDWKSLDLAGVSSKQLKQTLIDTAVELGKISEGEVDLTNFAETLKDEWADTEVMEKAFGKFAELTEAAYAAVEAGQYETASEAIQALAKDYDDVAVKAFTSAQEAKSFTEAIEATKDAVSSGWMKTSELIFGDYEEAKVLWTALSNTLWETFASGAETRNKKLAKALSSGWSKYLDLGIMDKQGYSEYFMEVARTRGIAIDKMVEEEGSLEAAIRKGLQEGSIATDVLTESLDSLTAAYENCSDEELKSLGYTREQVEALSELNKQFQNGEISIQEFADQMARFSGRELLFRTAENAEGELEYFGALPNIFKAINSFIQPIKDAWNEIFNPITAEQIYNVLSSLEKFTEKLILSDERAEKLQRTFRGLFSVLDMVWGLVKVIAKIAFGIISKMGFVIDIILSITSFIGDMLYNLHELIDASNTFDKFGDNFLFVVDTVTEGLKHFFSLFNTEINLGGFEKISETLKNIWTSIKNVGIKIKNFFKGLGQTIISAFSKENIETTFDNIIKLLTSGLLFALALGVREIIEYIRNIFKVIDLAGTFGEFMETLGDTLMAFQNKVNAQALKTIATSILLLVGALIVIALIPQEKLYDAITTIGLLATILAVVFNVIKAPIMKANNVVQLKTQLTSLASYFMSLAKFTTALSISILIMSFALKKLASLSVDEMARGFAALTGLLVVMVGAIKALEWASKGVNSLGTPVVDLINTNIKNITKLSWTLILLAVVLKILATLQWDEIARGLTAMAGVLVILSGTLALLALVAKINTVAISSKYIRKLSWTLLLLAATLKILGSLSWEETGRGLTALGSTLLILVGTLALLKLVSNNATLVPASTLWALTGIIVAIAASMTLISHLSWEGIAKGLVAMGGALAILIGTLAVISTLDPFRTILKTTSLVILASSLILVAKTLLFLGLLSWDIIKRGLVAMGGALAILTASLVALSFAGTGNLATAAASLIIMAIALTALIVPLSILGQMNLKTLATGIGAMAAMLAVLAVAGYALAYVAPALLLIGASALLFGEALMLISTSILIFTVALAGLVAIIESLCVVLSVSAGLIINFIVSLVIGIIETIPLLMVAIGKGLIALCDVIIAGAPKLAEALVSIILAALDLLVTLIPGIVDRLFIILVGILDSLSRYIPTIVSYILELVVNILDEVIKYVPVITAKLVELFTVIFTSLVEALKNINSVELMEGLKVIGLFTLVVIGLAAIAALTPLAMIGVIGLCAIATELVYALQIISKLADIPNIYETIDKATVILGALGKAVGALIGGFVGSVYETFSDSLPKIASNLSEFVTNLKPFIDGMKNVDFSVLKGAALLTAALMLITASGFISIVLNSFAGKNLVEDFAKNLNLFGTALLVFSNTMKDVDISNIEAGVAAGKKITEMISSIPKTGGLWQLLSGENNFSKFALELPLFGLGIKAFAKIISDADLTNIEQAAAAGVKLAEMMSKIPVSGGLWQLLSGENNLSKFAVELPLFGLGIKSFTKHIQNADFTNVEQAAAAGVTLAEMASKVPVSGGLWQLLSGSNSLLSFGIQLEAFGVGLKSFLLSIEGADLTTVEPAAAAGIKLAEMASNLPITGGLWQLLSGSTDLFSFGTQLAAFGAGLKLFTKTLEGVNLTNVDPAVTAGNQIAEMASNIPVTGGLWQLLSGSNNLSRFAIDIAAFGAGLKGFVKSVEGVNFVGIDPAVEAGLKLSEMASNITTTGGLWQLLTKTSLTEFSLQLLAFGQGIKYFVKELEGISFANVEPAASAGTKLAEMASNLPTSGGLWSLLAGGQSLSSFGTQLKWFGQGLSSFLESVKDVTFTNVDPAIDAGTKLAEMASNLPTSGGLWSLLAGGQSLSSFGTQLKWFGKGLSSFLESVKDVTFTNVEPAIDAGTKLAEMVSNIPDGGLFNTGKMDMSIFKTQLKYFGDGIKNFATTIKDVSFDNTLLAAEAGIKLAEIAVKIPSKSDLGVGAFGTQLVLLGQGIKSFAKSISSTDVSKMSNFINEFSAVVNKIKTLVNNGIKEIVLSFAKSASPLKIACKMMLNGLLDYINSTEEKFKTAGEELVKAFESGITENKDSVINAFNGIIDDLESVIENRQGNLRDSFYKSGKYSIEGFINGLKSKTGELLETARSLGEAAAKATAKALDERSPSKVYEGIGEYAGDGLIVGLDNSKDKVYNSAFGLGKMAVNGLKTMISKISDLLDSDIEVQPTITPVLNLDEVKSGIGSMNDMLSMSPSVNTLLRAASINAAVNSQIQNGGNDDVVSAIKGLQSSIEDNPREITNINGISYSEGTELADAIKTIIRIAKIEGRV